MNLMECKLLNLQKVCVGYLSTGFFLVEQVGNSVNMPFLGDDICIYIIIPFLVRYFGISLDWAIFIFFYSLVVIPLFVGIIGFFFLERRIIGRFVLIFGASLLTFFASRIGDTYISYFAAPMMLVPWSLYFYKRKLYDLIFFFFMYCTGFLVAFFHYVRTHSGLGVLAFILCLFLCQKSFKIKNKIALTLFLMLGALGPVFYFNNVFQNSVLFCNTSSSNGLVNRMPHYFWHSIYIGFGFLKMKNSDGIRYIDECGFKKAYFVDPSCIVIGSTITKPDRYEQILKNEVWNIIKNKPVYFLWSLFAKIGVLFMYFLIFANVGILFYFFSKQEFYINLAFLLMAGCYSLFPLLVIPVPDYALGFISSVALWGIFMVSNNINGLYVYIKTSIKDIWKGGS